MTDKQRIRTGVRFAVLITIICFNSLGSTSAFSTSGKERFWEEMDVTALLTAVRHRAGPVSEDEYEALVRLNLKHIYFNTLQTDQFLGMPKPDRVADQVCAVFRLSDEVRALLDEARRLSPEKASAEKIGKTARRIGERAGALHRRFREFFREENLTECGAELDLSGPVSSRFSQYLSQCEEVWTALNSELGHYFLNPSPGIIELSAYRTCSISELSLSLRKLSDSFEKSLSAR